MAGTNLAAIAGKLRLWKNLGHYANQTQNVDKIVEQQRLEQWLPFDTLVNQRDKIFVSPTLVTKGHDHYIDNLSNKIN